MSTLKPGTPEEASKAERSESALPGEVARVAVASVMLEALGDTETYWLSPSGDGQRRYELWSELDLLQGRFTCSVWLEDCQGVTARQAAEQQGVELLLTFGSQVKLDQTVVAVFFRLVFRSRHDR